MVTKKILLSRPYTWMYIILIGIATNLLATNSFTVNNLLIIDILISIYMWFTGLAILEYMHNKYEYDQDHRITFPSIMVILLTTFIGYMNIESILFVGFFVFGVVLYSLKVNSVLGRVSFLFRGFSELSLIFIILSIHNAELFTIPNILFALSIYFITTSRNLIGDIRDIKVDEFTLPVYNKKVSHLLSVSFVVVPIFLILELSLIIPLLFMTVIIAFFGIKDAYTTHRLCVICTIFFVSNYIFKLMGTSIIVPNLLFIGVILNFTYNHVPRKLDIDKN